jgi:hypothetical protein
MLNSKANKKRAVSSAVTCGDATTSQQPISNFEPKKAVSA